jgi:hypothetical protein
MWPTHFIPNQARVEGVPPPRYYLTTPPYPIEFTEALQSGGVPVRVGFVPFAEDEAYIQSGGSPVSGVMIQRLVNLPPLLEELECAGSPVSGVMVQRLIVADAGDEMIESSGLPISGIMRDPLVRYENWPLGYDTEDLLSAGQPVSGVLT